jgi:hypothetical protein
MSVYTSLLALLLYTTIMIGVDGDNDHAEQVRRAVEGGVDTAEEIAAVEAYGISNLETGEPMRRHLRLQAASIPASSSATSRGRVTALRS